MHSKTKGATDKNVYAKKKMRKTTQDLTKPTGRNN